MIGNMKRASNILIKVSFVVYILVISYLVFLCQRGYWKDMTILEYALAQINLIPFKTIGQYIMVLFDESMNISIPLTNLFGNLFMFMPLGIYVPFIFKNVNSGRKYFITILILLLTIEIIQFITKRGVFDIDDLILNLSGAMIGYWIWKCNKIKF